MVQKLIVVTLLTFLLSGSNEENINSSSLNLSKELSDYSTLLAEQVHSLSFKVNEDSFFSVDLNNYSKGIFNSENFQIKNENYDSTIVNVDENKINKTFKIVEINKIPDLNTKVNFSIDFEPKNRIDVQHINYDFLDDKNSSFVVNSFKSDIVNFVNKNAILEEKNFFIERKEENNTIKNYLKLSNDFNKEYFGSNFIFKNKND